MLAIVPFKRTSIFLICLGVFFKIAMFSIFIWFHVDISVTGLLVQFCMFHNVDLHANSHYWFGFVCLVYNYVCLLSFMSFRSFQDFYAFFGHHSCLCKYFLVVRSCMLTFTSTFFSCTCSILNKICTGSLLKTFACDQYLYQFPYMFTLSIVYPLNMVLMIYYYCIVDPLDICFRIN